MTAASVLQDTLRRDRLWVLSSLTVLTLLAWLYLVDMAAGMEAGTAGLQRWSLQYAGMMCLMWIIMMVGMMLPSAAPIMLLHARVCRRRIGRIAPTGSFMLGYIVAWTFYSVGATALQWALARLALLSPMMITTSASFGAGVLIAAGVYQLTPHKDACLAHCRSPMDFLAQHWRDGAVGAFRMGLAHGAYCVGCCWVLMVVLFAVGVMNLLWVAAITFFVLLEKASPRGVGIGRLAGVALIIAGLVMALTT